MKKINSKHMSGALGKGHTGKPKDSFGVRWNFSIYKAGLLGFFLEYGMAWGGYIWGGLYRAFYMGVYGALYRGITNKINPCFCGLSSQHNQRLFSGHIQKKIRAKFERLVVGPWSKHNSFPLSAGPGSFPARPPAVRRQLGDFLATEIF